VFLDRAGISACVLTPSALRLRAAGPPLDATPVAIDRGRLEAALECDGVVVVPGFVGEDEKGRAVLFGRGGSDLTALFLASVLDARCRLVKDVDGLYERDPSLAGPLPRRFAEATFEDLLATDGTIVQHKAARFARDHAVAFELGGFNGVHPTRIGAGSSRFSTGDREAGRPLRLAILGMGTVGGGVLELVRELPDEFEIDVAVDRAHGDPVGAAASGVDVVVELLGGREIARAAIAAAFASGAHVVTANKRVLAAHGAELRALAGSRRLLASAAVGGSAPILERIAEFARGELRGVRGVLNGTANFVLDRLAGGEDFENALAEARRRGYAERDATRDLGGQDAADKLALIGQALGLENLPVEIEGFGPEHVVRSRRAASRNSVLRQVAHLALDGSTPRAQVRMEEIDPLDPLHSVSGVRNAVVLETRDGGRECIEGQGAGRWPTAEAVLADLLELSRSRSRAAWKPLRAG
jgi:homoserine dehydrogenase